MIRRSVARAGTPARGADPSGPHRPQRLGTRASRPDSSSAMAASCAGPGRHAGVRRRRSGSGPFAGSRLGGRLRRRVREPRPRPPASRRERVGGHRRDAGSTASATAARSPCVARSRSARSRSSSCRSSRRPAAGSRGPRCATSRYRGMPGPGRDQLADDDVLLETLEAVVLALDRGLGEHPGGLLERGRRQPRVGGQRRLGDPHELGTTLGRALALGHEPLVHVRELAGVGLLTGQERPSRRAPTRRPGAASGGR